MLCVRRLDLRHGGTVGGLQQIVAMLGFRVKKIVLSADKTYFQSREPEISFL